VAECYNCRATARKAFEELISSSAPEHGDTLYRNSACVASGAAYRPPLLARCDIRRPKARRRSLSAALGGVPHHPTPSLPTDESQSHCRRRRRPPPNPTPPPLTVTPPFHGAAAHRRPRVRHRHRTRRHRPLAMRHRSGHPGLVCLGAQTDFSWRRHHRQLLCTCPALS